MKTDACKDLRPFPVRLQPSNDTGNTLTYFDLLLYLFPLSSSLLFSHLYHVFPIHSGCLTTTLLHQTQTVTQSIPAIASQTALSILGLTETWICPEDSATPAALSNNFSFSHPPPPPPVRLGRVEVLVFSFLTIGNTQIILLHAIITHWNLMLLL